jgi:hypothetical protein
MQPPGIFGSVIQSIHWSKMRVSRGSPRGALKAGSSTRSVKRLEATSSTATCSSSLLPKCENKPLLESLSSSASAPMVRPSSPSRPAIRNARSRMRSRVSSPFDMPVK